MTRTKYPDEFKEQVVREILEKERTIASVAAAESAEIARPRAEKRGAAGGERVLEKRCATRAGGLMRV